MRTLLLIICAAALGTASCITIATPAPVDETPQFVTATLRSTKNSLRQPHRPGHRFDLHLAHRGGDSPG